MAQVIAPENWQEGIVDNDMLPGRYTNQMFIGSEVKIANNASATRVWDIQVTDYITDYDDRRINGLTGVNSEGRDGWGASAYGVFQDVRFDSTVYTMGRHRSCAMRIFDEAQYSGAIGDWGSASTSNIITPGQALIAKAQQLSKARQRWEDTVLGPDIDKYNMFAVINGHISGRWVPSAGYKDSIMDGNAEHGQWVAQPGPVQGQAIPPRFAAIHGITWDDGNLLQMLNNVKTTWNNLHIPQDNRVVYVDPFWETKFLFALTGNGVPVTEAAYADIQNGSFVKLMGWEFNFEVPSQYWPKVYVDSNLNVVHGSGSGAAYDKVINSISGGDGDDKLMIELIAASRMRETNYVRTEFDATNGKFVKVVTNYPMGDPSINNEDGYRGNSNLKPQIVGKNRVDGSDGATVTNTYGLHTNETYPWTSEGAGFGLHEKGDTPATYGGATTAVASGPVTPISTKQVIGLFLYKKAAQLSQEYSSMTTEEGGTRGKFTEMVYDIKYDAWVIERYSHGIIPIFAPDTTTEFVAALPVKVVSQPSSADV